MNLGRQKTLGGAFVASSSQPQLETVVKATAVHTIPANTDMHFYSSFSGYLPRNSTHIFEHNFWDTHIQSINA